MYVNHLPYYNTLKSGNKVKGMSVGERAMLSEVVKLVRLLLVMPATNAVSERSFSAMRRIKTYPRSTMLQERLNAAMIIHIHKDLTDCLDLKSLSNNFIAKSDYRKSKFPMYVLIIFRNYT